MSHLRSPSKSPWKTLEEYKSTKIQIIKSCWICHIWNSGHIYPYKYLRSINGESGLIHTIHCVSIYYINWHSPRNNFECLLMQKGDLEKAYRWSDNQNYLQWCSNLSLYKMDR